MLRYEADGGRATITIDDPDRHNPLSNQTMRDLTAAVQAAAADDGVRVIVITGAGNRAFSAGGDLSGGFVDAPLADHGDRGALADLFRTLRRSGKPVVARVNGHALGGGFGLAAACDIVVAADTATLGTPEIRVGLWPMMITAVLMAIVPRRALLELMLTGRRLSAEEARDLGIVNRVVSPDELDEAVDTVVADLLGKSPAALALGKQAFYAVADLDFDSALDHLHGGLTAIAMTADAAEGVAAFGEKRKPQWRGR
jgi:enoyl-CoA hydratase/carnithine racemase